MQNILLKLYDSILRMIVFSYIFINLNFPFFYYFQCFYLFSVCKEVNILLILQGNMVDSRPYITLIIVFRLYVLLYFNQGC